MTLAKGNISYYANNSIINIIKQVEGIFIENIHNLMYDTTLKRNLLKAMNSKEIGNVNVCDF